MKNIIKVFLAFICLVLFVLLFIWLTLPKIEMAIASRNWKMIEGEVINNQLIANGGKKKNLSSLNFKYKYIVDSHTYFGASRFYDFDEPKQNFGIGKLKKFVKDFPTGSKIQVFFNPIAPENSTIKKGLLFQHWIILFINIFLILLYLHIIFFSNYYTIGFFHLPKK